jgi:hypothetical protein
MEFQLNKDEWENLIFHIGISSLQHGGRRFMPYAFTELRKLLMLYIEKNDKRVNEIIFC